MYHPLGNVGKPSSSRCFEVHAMRCNLERTGNENDELRNDLSKFWNMENLNDPETNLKRIFCIMGKGMSPSNLLSLTMNVCQIIMTLVRVDFII